MSYHILHILSHGAYLKKQQGKIIFELKKESFYRELPIEDLRAVVIAAKGVTLSDQLISGLMEQNAIILHCDNQYKPVGMTSPLERVIKPEIIQNQVGSVWARRQVWDLLLKGKLQNQQKVLSELQADAGYIGKHIQAVEEAVEKGREAKVARDDLNSFSALVNESVCARHYWKEVFDKMGFKGLRRRHDPDHPINKMLNYAYAVLASLCHRSLVIHGLSPLFGVHHMPRYQADAFVYDVMEPFRPLIDLELFRYLEGLSCEQVSELASEETADLVVRAWVKHSSVLWSEIELMNRGKKYKLVDAIDVYISGLVNIFKCNGKGKNSLWIPSLEEVRRGRSEAKQN